MKIKNAAVGTVVTVLALGAISSIGDDPASDTPVTGTDTDTYAIVETIDIDTESVTETLESVMETIETVTTAQEIVTTAPETEPPKPVIQAPETEPPTPVTQAPVVTEPPAPVTQAPAETEPPVPVTQAPVVTEPPIPVTQASVETEAPKPAETEKPVQVDTITEISVTSPIAPNSIATLTAKVLPNTEYDIEVYYSSGASKAQGLEPKTSDANGNISWSWKVGQRTKAGTYQIVISGNGEQKETKFTVTG